MREAGTKLPWVWVLSGVWKALVFLSVVNFITRFVSYHLS